MKSYHLVCVTAYEIVVPASRIVVSGFDGQRFETDQILPEKRWNHTLGERYSARTKAEASRLVKTGNWRAE